MKRRGSSSFGVLVSDVSLSVQIILNKHIPGDVLFNGSEIRGAVTARYSIILE